MGGQIVDATVVEDRPRLNRAEKETIKSGGVPADWKKARTRQIDRDGRWERLSGIPCKDRCCHAKVKRSSNRMASCALAMLHSRGGIFSSAPAPAGRRP